MEETVEKEVLTEYGDSNIITLEGLNISVAVPACT